MTAYQKRGARAGTVFGILIIFLILIGFNTITSEIISDLLGIGTGVTNGFNLPLLILFGLLGIWAGTYAARDRDPHFLQQALLNGAISGFVAGLIVAVLSIILGQFYEAGIDMREYLAQLSLVAINNLIHGRQPLVGAFINLLILTISGVLGSFLGYLLSKGAIQGLFFNWRQRGRDVITNTPGLRSTRNPLFVRYGIPALALLVVFILPQFLDKYWNFILGTVGIYVLMGLGLNIVVGMAGLLDLGYVAFFAVGAYTIGLLTSPAPIGLQWNFWTVLPLAVLIAAAAGIMLGIPVLRLRGDYLAIVTLGFGEIIRVLVKSDLLADYLGGPQGVRDIAGPSIFGIPFSSERNFMYMIILGILLVIFVTIRMQNSRVGRAWVAMREDETVAQAMGISTYKSKLLAFAIGAAFAGLGGVLFASRNQYTGPEDHNLLVSINVLSLIIVGGMGSIPGVILGAFALKGLPEILRQIEDYRILVFGALLVIMMIWRPEGLWPSKRRSLEFRHEAPELPPEPVHPKSTDVPAPGLTATTEVSIQTDPNPPEVNQS